MPGPGRPDGLHGPAPLPPLTGRGWLAATLVALAALGAAPAVALTPDPFSVDPLDRGATLVLPGVYRVDVAVSVAALETGDGRVVRLPRGARRFTEAGTGFGVASGGLILSAAHVAAGLSERIAALGYQRRLAAVGRNHSDATALAWARATGARPRAPRIIALRVTQARIAGAPARRYPARLVAIDREADLALIRIPARAAPALELTDSQTAGTGIVAIGHGGLPPAGPPTVRRGEIGRSGRTDRTGERRLAEVTAPIVPGDSGGPVVDSRGRVHGVIISFNAAGGIFEPPPRIRRLVARAGGTLGPNAAQRSYAAALRELWALRFDGATRELRRTETTFADHPTAGALAASASALRDRARIQGEEPARRFLLWLGGACALATLLAALAFGRLGRNAH